MYEEIASHFSDTRHTAWPRIAEFIKSLPAGSLLADIGCGNGKYLGLNKHIYEVRWEERLFLQTLYQDVFLIQYGLQAETVPYGLRV